MKKKAMMLLLALMMAFSTVAFAQQNAVIVTTTFFPLYVAAINITSGIPGVVVFNLTPPEAGCLHDYQLTTADRSLLEKTDVLVINGAGLEGFVDALLPSLSAHVVNASEGIMLLPGKHTDVNPHVWVSVKGMQAQVKNIVAGLCDADPANAGQYVKNGDAYLAKLNELERKLAAILLPIADAPIITFHEAFDYFAEDFGIRVVSVMENDVGNAPSARALTDVVETAKTENVKALFAEPLYQNITVDIIARETNLPVFLLDPIVSGEASLSSLNAYIDIMESNANTLLEALR